MNDDPEVDWNRLKELAELPEDFSPLAWQIKVVHEFLSGRPFVFLGGRKAGRSTALRLLAAADELRGSDAG